LEMCNYSSRKVKPLLSLYFSLLFFLYMYFTFQHTIGVLFFSRNSQPPYRHLYFGLLHSRARCQMS
jgi:hypothetical protein